MLESQQEVDSAFNEKIIVKEDRFLCKNCPDFVTIHRLEARTHGLICGLTKKIGRKSKKYKCPECGVELLGKKEFKSHVQATHTLPSYLCSICLKRFKGRITYKKHVELHNREASIPCPYCDKKFTIAAYRNKHIKRAHKNISNPVALCETVSENQVEVITVATSERSMDADEVLIKVDLHEEVLGNLCHWEIRYSFSVENRVRSRSFTRFHSSLEVNSREDWDAWIKVSKILALPVSSSEDPEGFEVALETNELGEITLFCAGTAVLTRHEAFDLQMKNVDSLLNELCLEEVTDDVGCAPNLAAEDLGANGDLSSVAGNTTSQKDSINEKQVKKTHECVFCGAKGFKDRWNMNRHIERLHMGPVKCSICEVVYKDKDSYLKECARTCFYWCEKPGCDFHEKRKSRVVTHQKTHARDN